MLQKLSTVIPCDSTGIFLSRIFHIYQRNFAIVGSFIKISVRIAKPRCRFRKKRKLKNFLVRTRFPLNLADGSWYRYTQNNSVTLKKRLYVRGRVILGPTTYKIKRKKFLKSFARIL